MRKRILTNHPRLADGRGFFVTRTRSPLYRRRQMNNSPKTPSRKTAAARPGAKTSSEPATPDLGRQAVADRVQCLEREGVPPIGKAAASAGGALLGSQILVKCLEREGVRGDFCLSGRRQHGDPPGSDQVRRRFAFTCPATNRAGCLRPRVTRGRRAGWGFAWPPAAPARRIWSPGSPMPTWIRCRSWRSPARCRRP